MPTRAATQYEDDKTFSCCAHTLTPGSMRFAGCCSSSPTRLWACPIARVSIYLISNAVLVWPSLLREAAGDGNSSADQACTTESMTSFRATSQALHTVLSLHISRRQLFPLTEHFLDKAVAQPLCTFTRHMHAWESDQTSTRQPFQDIIRSHVKNC